MSSLVLRPSRDRCNGKWNTKYYDVIKWRHFQRCWPFVRGIHRSPVVSCHKGLVTRSLMFFLIRVWTNGWANNRHADDFRRHRAHYHFTAVIWVIDHMNPSWRDDRTTTKQNKTSSWACMFHGMCWISQVWWRHQTETLSALLAFCAGNSPVTGEFPSQRPVTRSFMFYLICVWNNSWVNNGDAGDLRRHRDHYDVIIISATGRLWWW